MECHAVKYLFGDWTEIHDVIPTDLNYTFTGTDYRARLDRIYIRTDSLHLANGYKIIPYHLSDHDQLYLELKWGKRTKWGRGSWKLNSQLLTDANFQNEVKEAIEFHQATKHFHPIMEGWDTLKTKIKKIAIRISSQNSGIKVTK